jgi:hypothetical protein
VGVRLRTVSCVDLGCCAGRVPKHDGDGRVVLLHCWVGAREEGPKALHIISGQSLPL